MKGTRPKPSFSATAAARTSEGAAKKCLAILLEPGQKSNDRMYGDDTVYIPLEPTVCVQETYETLVKE